MAIFKQDYGSVPDVTIVSFGFGTTQMTISENEKEGRKSLLFRSGEPAPIGALSGKDNNSDEFKPEVVVTFSNVESFKVFKEYVDKIAKEYGIL